MMKKELTSPEDIRRLVDAFYAKVKADAVLAGIFNEKIRDRWPVHLEKMYRFWETVLLDEHTYTGSPFAPHARLPIGTEHFDRWLSLFHETLGEHFSGEKAEEAKWRAEKMAAMFLHKIHYFQNNPDKLLS